jgi:hypothetical protein
VSRWIFIDHKRGLLIEKKKVSLCQAKPGKGGETRGSGLVDPALPAEIGERPGVSRLAAASLNRLTTTLRIFSFFRFFACQRGAQLLQENHPEESRSFFAATILSLNTRLSAATWPDLNEGVPHVRLDVPTQTRRSQEPKKLHYPPSNVAYPSNHWRTACCRMPALLSAAP